MNILKKVGRYVLATIIGILIVKAVPILSQVYRLDLSAFFIFVTTFLVACKALGVGKEE